MKSSTLIPIFVTVLVILSASPSQAVEPVVLTDDKISYNLNDHIEILADKNTEWTIEDVSGPDFDGRFKKMDAKSIGYSYYRLWFRFTVQNESAVNTWALDFGYPLLNEVYVYVPHGGGFDRNELGRKFSFSDRKLKSNTPAALIHHDPGERKTIYFSIIQITDALYLDVALKRMSEFNNQTFYINVITGILIGLVIAMVIYNIIVFVFIRNSEFLYLAFMALFTFLLAAAESGHGYSLFWGGQERFLWSNTFIASIAMILFMIFLRKFLNTATIYPKFDRFLLFIVALFTVNVVLTPTIRDYDLLSELFVSLAGFVFFVILIAQVYYSVKGDINSRLFLLSMAPGLVIYTVAMVSLFTKSEIVLNKIHIMHYGNAIVAISFSVVLSYKYKKSLNEKQEAQQKIIENEKRAREDLEIKVEERTAELAEANERLMEMDRTKTRFFANISHEIRTPLTLILSPVESALQGDYNKKVDDLFLQNIQRNAIRLLRLINNLLDFTKIEEGKMITRVREVDIVDLMKNYISTVQSSAESKGISLNFTSRIDALLLYLDIEKTEKITMNLFSNALKFTDPGGNIEIGIYDDEANCYVYIEDTGVGIPKDKIDSVFDRFGQADTSSTREYEGTGIGLALAKELIEMHGGTISVESRYRADYPDNHGSTFNITIPKGKEHFTNRDDIEFITGPKLEETFTDRNQHGGTRAMTDLKPVEDDSVNREADSAKPVLLIVEDNPDMRNFLGSLLGPLYEIYLARNGEEGLKSCYSLKPDCVITDVMMPVMDGYEMTRKIKEDPRLKRIPVLMLTARAEITQKVEGLEYGADDYLTKPFNSKELLARIRTQIEKREYEKVIENRKEEIERELETARLLQQRLLPEEIPEVSGFTSHVAYIPMDKVGGDFYSIDYNERDNLFELFIADVSGHGLPGAFLATITKMALDSINDKRSATGVQYLLNDVVYRYTVNNNYVTTFYGLINTENNTMRYSNAGHCIPFIYRPEQDEFIELKAGGIPLGWFTNMKLEEKEVQLQTGDRLLLYTDGITECMNDQHVLFDDTGFQEFIRANKELEPHQFTDKLLKHLRNYCGRDTFEDDVCLVVVDVL